ncbi:hypothetical protein AHF37_09183 [Paragonimus kellicotti]|nr:hypothetical protein AHF37_09183 [Paragonimus kellicotti]
MLNKQGIDFWHLQNDSYRKKKPSETGTCRQYSMPGMLGSTRRRVRPNSVDRWSREPVYSNGLQSTGRERCSRPTEPLMSKNNYKPAFRERASSLNGFGTANVSESLSSASNESYCLVPSTECSVAGVDPKHASSSPLTHREVCWTSKGLKSENSFSHKSVEESAVKGKLYALHDSKYQPQQQTPTDQQIVSVPLVRA